LNPCKKLPIGIAETEGDATLGTRSHEVRRDADIPTKRDYPFQIVERDSDETSVF
jgi:hypothetical protein